MVSFSVFPKVFSSSLVKHELVGNYSHLFTVPGKEPDLEPYMLLAHIDVVPADEADGWDAPPFSAQEIDGFIYGRGTIDNKQSVMVQWISTASLFIGTIALHSNLMLTVMMCVLEGDPSGAGIPAGTRLHPSEKLLHWFGSRWGGQSQVNWLVVVNNSYFNALIYTVSCQVNGLHGAVNIVKLLKSRGVKLQYVLDEGLAVLDGVISGMDGPAALWDCYFEHLY